MGARIVVRAIVELCVIAVYIAPESALSVEIKDPELLRLSCTSFLAMAAYSKSLKAGPIFFVHAFSNILVNNISTIRSYMLNSMNEHIDALLPWISAAIWALRVFTFQQLVDAILSRNKTFEARFKDNKAKLVAFFKLHDPSRIPEASALLHEYLGNESLLFVKLKRIYTKPSQVVLKSENSL